jgi:hypothetical protein
LYIVSSIPAEPKMNSSKLDVLAAAVRDHSYYGQDHGKEMICNPGDYSSKAVARDKVRVTTDNGSVETLHAILSDRGFDSIITWLPSGKAFAILDRLEYRRLFFVYQFGNLNAYNPSNTVAMHCNTNTAYSQESKSTRQIQKLNEMITLCEERLAALEKFKVLKQKDLANKIMGRSQSS